MFVYRLKDGSVLKKDFDIIRGADRGDRGEIENALREDPSCLNYQDPTTGLTAAHLLAGDGNLTLIKFLGEQPGINFLIYDHRWRTPIDMADVIGRNDIAHYMADKAWGHLEEEEDENNINSRSNVIPIGKKPSGP